MSNYQNDWKDITNFRIFYVLYYVCLRSEVIAKSRRFYCVSDREVMIMTLVLAFMLIKEC